MKVETLFVLELEAYFYHVICYVLIMTTKERYYSVTCYGSEDSGRSIIKTIIKKMIEVIQAGTSQYIQICSLRIIYP